MPDFQTVDGIPDTAVRLILDAAVTQLGGADFDRDAYVQAVFDGLALALGAILDDGGTPAAELLAAACAGTTRPADACTATNLEHNLAVCDCDEPIHPDPQIAAEIAQDAAEADAADAAAGMPRATTGPLTTADDDGPGLYAADDAADMPVQIGRVLYRVERRDSTQEPYRLHGPRGACYALWRNVPNPSRLFLVNVRGFTRGTPDVWFRDDGGVLRPC